MGKELAYIPRDAAIRLGMSAEYVAITQKVSAYIYTLPLTAEQNATLVSMLTEHQCIGRTDAFRQGIGLAAKVIDYCEEE